MNEALPTKKKRPLLRIVLLAIVGLGLFLAARYFGWIDDVDARTIQTTVEDAGPWGALVFVAVFCLGLFFHIPGMVFVVAGVLIYGRMTGFFVAHLGAVVAVTFTFVLVRRAGGQALTEIDKPIVNKVMAHIERRPITTVAILRLFFWLAPAMNYALAMSNVRFREFLIGSAIGLVAPIAFVTAMSELFL